jgi:hypothetical protein
MKLLQKLKAWWVSRHGYHYQVDTGRNKLYDCYFYPNQQCVKFTAPAHLFYATTEKDLVGMLKCREAEYRTGYAKAFNKPLKKVMK